MEMSRHKLPKCHPDWVLVGYDPWRWEATTPKWFTAGIWLRHREALQQAGFTMVHNGDGFNLVFTIRAETEAAAVEKRDRMFAAITF